MKISAGDHVVIDIVDWTQKWNEELYNKMTGTVVYAYSERIKIQLDSQFVEKVREKGYTSFPSIRIINIKKNNNYLSV